MGTFLLGLGGTVLRWFMSEGLASLQKRREALEERRRIALELGHEETVKRLDAEIERVGKMIEGQGQPEPWTRIVMRGFVVWPAIILLWKLVVWDTVLDLGVTRISDFMEYYVGAVISYYLAAFGYDFYQRRRG